MGQDAVFAEKPPSDEPPAGDQESIDAPDDTGIDPLDDEIELVIGITRAVGTPKEAALKQLVNSLNNYGYEVHPVKISDLLTDSRAARATTTPAETLRAHERITALIDEGNRICEEASSNSELAVRSIGEIQDKRATVVRDEEPDAAAGRRAYVVDSLKRPEEVTLLRSVYGDHFVLIGLQASEKTRLEQLTSKFSPRAPAVDSDVEQVARDLMKRDNTEATPFGQDMLRTFPMVDVFVQVDSSDEAHSEMRRTIELLFGDPQAPEPTPVEYGMQLATQTSAMSPELGLRVGAVIIGPEGSVLATGCNRHPVDERSPDFDESAVDVRRLAQNTLELLSSAGLLTDEAKTKLADESDEYVRSLLSTVLRDSQLKDVTEFQRPIHAEMNAVMSAVRQRVALDGATMCVTAYPCHNCAKHLIALGLEVVYLEPYAKSRAGAMYGRETLKFRPFTGVAPRRFDAWFVTARLEDRKDAVGARIEWSASQRKNARPKVSRHITGDSNRRRERFALGSVSARI